jgi:hypothetical protein
MSLFFSHPRSLAHVMLCRIYTGGKGERGNEQQFIKLMHLPSTRFARRCYYYARPYPLLSLHACNPHTHTRERHHNTPLTCQPTMDLWQRATTWLSFFRPARRGMMSKVGKDKSCFYSLSCSLARSAEVQIGPHFCSTSENKPVQRL